MIGDMAFICFDGGDPYEERMENAVDLYCHSPGGGRIGRVADAGEHGGIRADEQAAVGSTGVAVSCGVDDPVCTDGAGVVFGLYVRREAQRERTGAAGLRSTVGGKLFLVDPVL